MIDKDRIKEEIEDSLALLERLELKVDGGCPCGCLALKSGRTSKVQVYSSVDEITYTNILAFSGPAFRQLVTRGPAAEVAGQTTFDCVIEAIAIARSCSVASHASQASFGEDDNHDAE